jgi:nitrogen regulatory protein P-II 1
MKLITAIIQPDKLDEVREALVKVDVPRITVSRCTGHGRKDPDSELYRGEEFVPDLSPKVRIDIACNDEFVAPACLAILTAARHASGTPGDGKIFVVPLEQCIRIGTEETGRAAI